MAASTIDEYIAGFPKEVQEKLQKLRTVIAQEAPGAEEAMRYGVPAFKLQGHLVVFAAFKNHIGFYPEESGIEAFKEELAGYKTAKGTIQFPLDKPIPWDLVKEIVKFRVKENLGQQK